MSKLSILKRIAARPLAILSTVMMVMASFAPSTTVGQDTWTTGTKKVLIIPVRFTDQGGPSDAPGPGGFLSGWGKILDGSTQTEVAAFMAAQSYGKCDLEFTLLPEIDLGVSYTTYNANLPGTPFTKFNLWNAPGSFADDVRAKAKLVGQGTGTPAMYDTANYDLDIIACGFIPGLGTISSGSTYGKGVLALSFKPLAHELCHNFGMQHAIGISRATYYSPLRTGSFFQQTYGDVLCLMGYKNTSPIPIPPDRDANPYWKWLVGWMPDDAITTTNTSGTYRVHAFDQGSLSPGNKYALRVVRDGHRTYWLSYRDGIVGDDAIWSDNGLEVHFGGESIQASSGQSILLDMTPGSRGAAGTTYATMHDAPLPIGRTYSDREAGMHVTPIRKGGTTPESLDVVLNFGTFPGNNAPGVSLAPPTITIAAGVAQTFTATASDPDGDTLSYHWEFDDNDVLGGTSVGGTNADATLSTQGQHTWARSGLYQVRCTVSDMKGRTARAVSEVTVTGGTAALMTISGTVRDEFNNPISGAIVNNFRTTAPIVGYGDANFVGSGETGPDGKYIIPLPNGNGTYVLTAMSEGFAYSCSVGGGSITVSGASQSNVNFTRLRSVRTVSGAVVVAGRSYDPATDGPLTISDGTQSVLAGVGSWSMNIQDGSVVILTATPDNPSYTVLNYFPNPYYVVDNYNQLHFDVKIPGAMPETQFVSASAGSDDGVGVVQIPVEMSLPAANSSWVQDQEVYYWIDSSSTAEYGVDYRMTGGSIRFYGGVAPTTRFIPLEVIEDDIPKTRTVVIKLGPTGITTNVGPINTFTYTITNPPPAEVGEWSVY